MNFYLRFYYEDKVLFTKWLSNPQEIKLNILVQIHHNKDTC